MASRNELSLKLLVDTKSNKVLLAEADKEFVDFLFRLLAFPVGAIVRLNSGTSAMPGSVGALYQSVVHMGASYLQPNFEKSDLLLLPVMPPRAQRGGYVKAQERYVVTDGLEVTPMSTVSNLALVDRFGAVGNQGVELAEKVVTVGAEELAALVKEVMRSDTVLSDVFLARKK